MRVMNKLAVLLLLFCLNHTVMAARVGTGGLSAAFSKDSASIGVVVGSGTAFDDDYMILGLGAGYYVINGLEIGIGVQYWISGEPSITKVTPKMTYVFTQPTTIRPYLGIFYRRTFYGDYDGVNIDEQNSYGYRAGAYLNSNDDVYIGGGLVYEKYVDCNLLVDCSSIYPEVIFAISF
jgi:long-subunit fatty acid transport protein